MQWVFLCGAVICEVIGTIFLRLASAGKNAYYAAVAVAVSANRGQATGVDAGRLGERVGPGVGPGAVVDLGVAALGLALARVAAVLRLAAALALADWRAWRRRAKTLDRHSRGY